MECRKGKGYIGADFMDLKIISWNVRGLCNREKCCSINQGFINARPDLICLQDTKLRVISNLIVKDIWGSSSSLWLALPS